MNLEQEIPSDDEIILRRIPPEESGRPRGVIAIPGGGFRATSFAIRQKNDEVGPSFTRLRKTSPRGLLDLLADQNILSEGWVVCRLKVSEVRAIGWKVILAHNPKDPGHCEIHPTTENPFRDNRWSRLAKKTRVLSCNEVKSLKAGDHLAG